MEAAVLEDYESAPEFGEFEEPQANGLTVVEVAVAGLNPVDQTIASGRFPGREPPLPSVPGLEGIGTVAGRRVWGRKSPHRKLVIEVSPSAESDRPIPGHE